MSIIFDPRQYNLTKPVFHLTDEQRTRPMHELVGRYGFELPRSVPWKAEVVAIVDAFQKLGTCDCYPIINKIKVAQNTVNALISVPLADAYKCGYRKLFGYMVQ
jgi:hypothetical protein